MQKAIEKPEVESKGVHIITVCDARGEFAQNISRQLEEIRIHRERFLNEISYREAKLKVALFEAKDEQKRRDILANITTLFPVPINEEIDKRLLEFQTAYQYWLGLLHKNFKKRETIIENITTTAGRTVLARRLSGNTTYTAIVNYTALGTSNTAPGVAQVQLGTETYRKGLSSGTFANNIAYLETFFTASEVSGTFEEYGNFIDGNGSANTGQIFNRFIQTTTKSLTETLNVQSTVTFADA